MSCPYGAVWAERENEQGCSVERSYKGMEWADGEMSEGVQLNAPTNGLRVVWCHDAGMGSRVRVTFASSG